MLEQHFKEHLESMGMDICPIMYDPTTFTPIYSVVYCNRILKVITLSDYFDDNEINTETINNNIIIECNKFGLKIPNKLKDSIFGIKKQLIKLKI